MSELILNFKPLRVLALIFAASIFTGFSGFSQLVPEIKCVVVNPDGSTLITWQPPSDPGGLFFSYELFWVNAGVDEQLVEIFNINTNTYTHPAAQANLASREYKIRTRSGPIGQFTSAFSQSAFSIYLQVNAAALNAIALLSWNKMTDPIGSSSSGFYDIYREFPIGTWVFAGSTVYGNESYSDTILGICADPPVNINYRVLLDDNFGCSAVSNVDGALLTDAIGPTPPVIETISVDTLTNEFVICWYSSPESDTDGYKIQNVVPPAYITIANLNDPDTTCYYHSNGGLGSQQYVVIAYDECGNDESFGTPHYSSYLTGSLNTCAQQFTLQWTPYQGWAEGVASYQIRAQINGAPSVLMQTLSGNTLSTIVPVNPFDIYCFFIVATSNGIQRPSISNKYCQEATYPPIPQFLYLNRVSVISKEEIEVNLLPDPLAFGVEYRLERKSELDNDFEEIGNMEPIALSILFGQRDIDVNTNEFNYRYRIAAYDACGAFTGYSNVSRNILLRASSDSELYISKLQWNQYEGWNGGVAQYNIYRSISSAGEMTLLTTVPGNITYYEDNVFDLIDTHGEFCYFIEAVENLNDYDRADVVQSNISCAVQEPLFWIPNAFVVGGFNNEFKPTTGYIDFQRYEMQIFSRWGRLMFSTNDINQGWNGEYKGKIAPEGAYVYYITIRAGDGKTFEESGTVVLLNGQ